MGDTSVLLPVKYDGIRAVFSGAVFSQMFACLCSLSREYDPDHPKGVSKKTVTAEKIDAERTEVEWIAMPFPC